MKTRWFASTSYCSRIEHGHEKRIEKTTKKKKSMEEERPMII
jgi:hypothetical protein